MSVLVDRSVRNECSSGWVGDKWVFRWTGLWEMSIPVDGSVRNECSGGCVGEKWVFCGGWNDQDLQSLKEKGLEATEPYGTLACN